MGNSLRCCLTCLLPCGALDLIRVVHLNGCVDELTARITAGEFLRNYPNHVLTEPSVSRRIVIMSPQSELKRGSIYFLIPSSSASGPKKKPIRSAEMTTPEEKPSRRKVTAAVWQPQLDSIYEEL